MCFVEIETFLHVLVVSIIVILDKVFILLWELSTVRGDGMVEFVVDWKLTLVLLNLLID